MRSSKLGRSVRKLLVLSCVLVPFAAALPGCDEETPEDPYAVTVGLLLPFTGAASATASNFERAVLYAADRINQGGGIKGHPVRVVSRDTHSDAVRSKQSVDELIKQGAVVVIGPESSEIAAEIKPILDAHDVVFLSPLVGAADDHAVDCTHPWFRLAPSARALGEAMAKRLSAQQINEVAIIHSSGAYDEALRSAVSSRFVSLGGTVAFDEAVDPNAQSYADPIRKVLAADVDAVVLATSPRAAALGVNEFDAVSENPPLWFLSPLLKTELLVQNVAPEALEGAEGVAPKIYDTSTAFPTAFATRWSGDHPLEGAYFYYDAIGLLAFALQKSPLSKGKVDVEALQAAIRSVAGPPGEAAGWDEIESGLARLRKGDTMYYSGLTGPMLLQSCGDRRLGVSSAWTVHAGAIAEVPDN